MFRYTESEDNLRYGNENYIMVNITEQLSGTELEINKLIPLNFTQTTKYYNQVKEKVQ